MDKHTLIKLMAENGFSAIRLEDGYTAWADRITAVFYAPTQVPVEIIHYHNNPGEVLVSSPANPSFDRHYADDVADAVVMQTAQEIARQVGNARG